MADAATAFLFGWRKLLDELRLPILAYILPSGETYRASDFGKQVSDSQPRPTADEYRRLVLPLLSIPDVRGLVNEVLYAQNTACVIYDPLQDLDNLAVQDLPLAFHDHRQIPGTMYPPLHTRSHVRRLQLKITYTDVSTIQFLQTLTSEATGFTMLHYLTLRIEGLAPEKKKVVQFLTSIPHIAFATRRLEAIYCHYCSYRTSSSWQMEVWPDILEMPLLERLTAAGYNEAGTYVEEKRDCYYRHEEDASTRRISAVWPSVMVRVREGRGRVTKKTMSVL